jgi:hypothetical protein
VLISRRAVLIGVAALLGLAVIGALLWSGSRRHDPLRTSSPSVVVLQQWNGRVDPDSVVSYTAFAPDTAVGTLIPAGPGNATNASWSPTGSHVAYTTVEAGDFPGLNGVRPRLRLKNVFVAAGDWTRPLAVQVSRPMDDYELYAGIRWSPVGERFLLPWSTHSCTGGSDCVPPSGFDVFESNGSLVEAIETPGNVDNTGIWSPEGRAIGWTTGSCPGSVCQDDAIHWRSLDGDATETTLSVAELGGAGWSADGRFVVVTVHVTETRTGDIVRDEYRVTRVYSMRQDGSDDRDIPWSGGSSLSLTVSPDGRLISSFDPEIGRLRIRDVASGHESVAAIRPDLNLIAWSPDGRWAILQGDSSDGRSSGAFYVMASDGSGFAYLGDADGTAWAPIGILAP